VAPKTRLKGIRRAILEQLGVQDICTARIFSCTKPAKKPEDEEGQMNAGDELEKEPEEEKAEEDPVDDANYREPLFGEMATLENLGL